MPKPEPTFTDRLIDHAAQLHRQEAVNEEKRAETRRPFDYPVVLVLVTFDGQVTPPIVVQGVDISYGGLRVSSRHMIHPGSLGAVQLARSGGEAAIAGVRVQHCRYIGGMRHHTGLKFVPLPDCFKRGHCSDERGRPLIAGQRQHGGRNGNGSE